MIYEHFSDLPANEWSWPHFSPEEVSCRCCGELYLDLVFMDYLEHLRELSGRAVQLYSGHRCALHNARVGGAPLSEHKKIAADVGLAGHVPLKLLADAKKAGFRSFGFYKTFLHMDRRQGRRWYAKGAREIWNGSRIS